MSESSKNKCNLSTCRYNHNGICQNEEKRKECVGVSEAVLCVEDIDISKLVNLSRAENMNMLRMDFSLEYNEMLNRDEVVQLIIEKIQKRFEHRNDGRY